MSTLEERYRRLLGWFPRDHRERHGEEMLSVLMAAGRPDQTKPGPRDTMNLLGNAALLHLRRMVVADGGVDFRDVLAIVSLLGPIALLTGATFGLHELAWWVRAGSLPDRLSWSQFLDIPVWTVWLVVAVLGLSGKRRAAAAGAWLGTAGFLVLTDVFAPEYMLTSRNAGWALLGLLTAVALTWSPGPVRGRELVTGRMILVMAGTAAVATVFGVFGYGDPKEEALGLLVLAIGTVAACAPRTRAGHRAALILLVPLMTVLLWNVIDTFALLHNPSPMLLAAIHFSVPLLVLLAFGGLPRRAPARRTPASPSR